MTLPHMYLGQDAEVPLPPEKLTYSAEGRVTLSGAIFRLNATNLEEAAKRLFEGDFDTVEYRSGALLDWEIFPETVELEGSA